MGRKLTAALSILLTSCAGAPVPPLAYGDGADDASGCWVNAYAETQYRPPLATYTGPSADPVFTRRPQSVVVGPQARLVAYSKARFDGKSWVLPPGARVPDLKAVGLPPDVDSFELVCVSSDAARGLVNVRDLLR